MKKSTLLLLLIPILTCLFLGGYYINLSMSEGIRFAKNSIEYRLLTPDILKGIKTGDTETIKHYYYSAADGNKPLINAVELESGEDINEIEKKLTQYLINHHYTNIKPGEFIKDNQQISISFEKKQANIWNVSVTLLEVIK